MSTVRDEQNKLYHRSLGVLRLGQFDIAGVLYHANYFHLYEVIRESLFSEHGAPYLELVQRNAHLAVVESHQEFLRPVHYGDCLAGACWVSELRKTGATINYEIALCPRQPPATANNAEISNTLLHRAWTRHAYVEPSRGNFKVSRIPQKLVNVLQQFVVEERVTRS